MKCRRTAIIADVEPYELGKGMEDGFALWSDVVTRSYTNTDELIKVTREDGTVVCPYVTHRRGRTFIQEGDYIITDEDGTRHVCGSDKIFTRYEKI